MKHLNERIQNTQEDITANEFLEFIADNNIADATIVKALEILDVGYAVYDVDVQFEWKEDLDYAGLKCVPVGGMENGAETTIVSLVQDLFAIEEKGGGDLDQIKLKLFNAADDNNKKAVAIVYDDRTNIMFFVINAGRDRNLETAKNFVEELAEYVHDLNNAWNCDKNGIEAAVGHLDREYFEEHKDIELVIGSMLKRGADLDAFRAKLREWDGGNADQHDGEHEGNALANDIDDINDIFDELENGEADDDKDDEPGENPEEPPAEEPEQNPDDKHVEQPVKPEEPIENPENNQEQDDQPRVDIFGDEEPDLPEEPDEKQEEPGENVNGLRVLGEWDGREAGNPAGNVPFVDFNIALSPLDYNGFKAEINKLGPEVIAVLADKPVKFKRIDPGKFTGRKDAKGRYNDLYDQVYKNFQFFYVFSGKNTCIWKKTKLGHIAILKSSTLRADMFSTMVKDNGNKWVPMFYNDTKKGGVGFATLEVIWADAGGYVQKPDNQVKPVAKPAAAAAGNAQAVAAQAAGEKPKFDLREVIKKKALEKMMEVFNARRQNGRPIRIRYSIKIRNTNKVLVDGGGAGHRNFHTLNENDIKVLADHYDTWSPSNVDRPYLGELMRACNPDNMDKAVLIDPAIFQARRKKGADEKLDALQARVDKAAAAMKLIQVDAVAAAAQRPEGCPAEGEFLHVRFPGASAKKLIGKDAEAFLAKFRLFDKIKPVLDEMLKDYPKAQLFISMNNKLIK